MLTPTANVIPSYRQAFYERLFNTSDIQVTVYCQNKLEGLNLNLCHQHFTDHIELVTSSGLSKEKLTWQHLPIRQLLNNYDYFVFYGNPRVLSNIIWSCIFKLVGKKVAIWGQAHTAGSNPLMEKLRLSWWKLFDNLFVYTDAEVGYLQQFGFKALNIVGMNNGLDQEKIEQVKSSWSGEHLAQWQQENQLASKTIILSCARLEPKNQFHRFLEILPELSKHFPDLVWCVIGSGSEQKALKQHADQLQLEQHIRWVGSLYEESELAPWFLSAKVLVHPGAIGLSLLHAFGYGLPVITHDNPELHMPEFSAMKEGETGYLFEEGKVESLTHQLRRALSNAQELQAMSGNALSQTQKHYNVDVMCRRFQLLAAGMES